MDHSPTLLSVFSGIGSLELGLRIALPDVRVLGYIERDSFAAAVLMARMEESTVAPAPVFVGDVSDVDGRELRDRVDIMAGGFPCQDISIAGAGAGLAGPRSRIWSEFVRLVDEIRPALVFVENAPTIFIRGIDRILGDLAAIGFNAEWDCFRSSDHGAPHRRNRFFLLAHAGRDSIPRDGRTAPREETGDDRRRTNHDHRIKLVRGSLDAAQSEPPCPSGNGKTLPPRAMYPPRPSDGDGWRDTLSERPHLSPKVKPGIRFVVDGDPLIPDENRTDRLRALGNGIVPLQCAIAFRTLFQRIGETDGNLETARSS